MTLAFGVVALLQIVAASVSWLSLRSSQNAQTTLLEKTLPLAVASQRLAADSSQLAQYAQLLPGTDTASALAPLSNKINQALSDVDLRVQQNRDIATTKVSNLLDQSKRNFQAALRSKEQELATHQLAANALTSAQSLVKSLSLELELAIETLPFSATSASRVRETTTLINGWSGLLSAAAAANSSQATNLLRNNLAQEIRLVTRNLVEYSPTLASPVTSESLLKLLDQCNTPTGLFESRKRVLANRTDVNTNVNAALATVTALNDSLSEQTSSNSAQLTKQGLALNQQMVQSVWVLLALSLLAVILSLFFVNHFVINGVAQPLLAIADRTDRLARGDLTSEIEPQSFHELLTIRNALQVFQSKLIRLQETDEEMRAQNQLLNETNEDLNRFTYAASHDLRSPLRGIGTLAGFLQEDLGDHKNPAVKHNLERMQGRLRQMEELLEGLLAYSKAGSKASASTELDIEPLVQEAVELVDSSGRVKLTLKLSEPTIDAPHTVISQVIRNIIDNSIKHHHQPADQPIHIEATSSISNDYQVISITDDGPGIPLEYRSRVMELFQTLAVDTDNRSSGIGLSLVRKLVQKYGGDIKITGPNSGTGTQVLVYWPLEPEVVDESKLRNYIKTA